MTYQFDHSALASWISLPLSAFYQLSLIHKLTRFRFLFASTWNESSDFSLDSLPRKEVIQPHLPIRLPCYDFTPVIGFALGNLLTDQLWAPPTSMV